MEKKIFQLTQTDSLPSPATPHFPLQKVDRHFGSIWDEKPNWNIGNSPRLGRPFPGWPYSLQNQDKGRDGQNTWLRSSSNSSEGMVWGQVSALCYTDQKRWSQCSLLALESESPQCHWWGTATQPPKGFLKSMEFRHLSTFRDLGLNNLGRESVRHNWSQSCWISVQCLCHEASPCSMHGFISMGKMQDHHSPQMVRSVNERTDHPTHHLGQGFWR